MSKVVCGWITGVIFGILFYMLTIERINLANQDRLVLLINYCEVELPRTQSCELIAVLKEPGDN
jgi:hypothetical protein